MTDREAEETVTLTSKRSALLSDDAWAALKEAGTIEGKSASGLCEYLLSHYLNLDEKPIYSLPASEGRAPRSLYIADTTWAAAKAEAVMQKRSVSAMLEQTIRGYVGLELGPRMT